MSSVANLLKAGIVSTAAITLCLTAGSADAKPTSKSKPVRVVIHQMVVHPGVVPRTSPVVPRATTSAGNLNAGNSRAIR